MFFPELAKLTTEFLPQVETAYYIHNFKGSKPGARQRLSHSIRPVTLAHWFKRMQPDSVLSCMAPLWQPQGHTAPRRVFASRTAYQLGCHRLSAHPFCWQLYKGCNTVVCCCHAGVLFRAYPGPWQVLRRSMIDPDATQCVWSSQTRPTLKQVSLEILPNS